jgi:hypothetical protein
MASKVEEIAVVVYICRAVEHASLDLTSAKCASGRYERTLPYKKVAMTMDCCMITIIGLVFDLECAVALLIRRPGPTAEPVSSNLGSLARNAVAAGNSGAAGVLSTFGRGLLACVGVAET